MQARHSWPAALHHCRSVAIRYYGYCRLKRSKCRWECSSTNGGLSAISCRQIHVISQTDIIQNASEPTAPAPLWLMGRNHPGQVPPGNHPVRPGQKLLPTRGPAVVLECFLGKRTLAHQPSPGSLHISCRYYGPGGKSRKSYLNY